MSRSIWIPRLILAAVFISCTVFSPQLQPLLSGVYDYLCRDSALYRFSGFETLETILSYAVIEPLFTYKFGHSPERRIDVREKPARGPEPGSAVLGDAAKTWRGRDRGGRSEADLSTAQESQRRPKLPKMKRPSKRLYEMLRYAVPLLLLDFTMVKKYSGVPMADIAASAGYEALLPATTSSLEQQTAYDMSSNMTVNDYISSSSSSKSSDSRISPSFLIPTLHNFTLHSPVQLTRALPPDAPTPLQLLLQLLLSLTIYDTLFFLFHLLLHRPPTRLITSVLPFVSPTFVSGLHSPHHSHPEMHPQITNQLSQTERFSLILLANLSLNLIGAHVLTRTLFVPVFLTLLVQIHSGLDLEWGYEKLLPPGLGSGSRAHARHHRYGGDEALAPFFAWWDAALVRWDLWSGRRRTMMTKGGQKREL